jgi:long-chain acyl-CoA synthetase
MVDHPIDIISFEDIDLSKDAEITPFAEKINEEIALIIYTSGTTGKSKGVMLTFAGILENVKYVSLNKQIVLRTSKQLAMLPFHHIMPLVFIVLGTTYIGGTLIFVRSLAIEDILALLQKEKPTLIIYVTKFFELFMKKIKHSLSMHTNISREIQIKQVQGIFGGNIEHLVSGGAPLNGNTMKDYMDLGFKMVEGYGMTETSPMISLSGPENIKMGSVGPICDYLEAKIVDDEVVVRGRTMMVGYYNNLEETNKVIKDGWLYTGDKGYIDDEG